MFRKSMRILSLVLVVMFAFGAVLTGCGAKTETSTETPVEPAADKPAAAEIKEATEPAAVEKATVKLFLWIAEDKMNTIIEAFNKDYPNITIEYSQAPAVQPYLEKLKTLLITNQASDVFYVRPDNISDLYEGDYCLDVTNQPYIANINELNKKLYTREGKVLGASGGNWVGGIVYNKTVFKKAGIEKEPDTLAELAEAMKKIEAIGILPFANQQQDAACNLLTGMFGANVVEKIPDHQEQIYAGTKTNADFWTEQFNLFNELFVKPGYIKC